ncbi:hypothetical protein BGZ65_012798, partial [Modicella reniformis]
MYTSTYEDAYASSGRRSPSSSSPPPLSSPTPVYWTTKVEFVRKDRHYDEIQYGFMNGSQVTKATTTHSFPPAQRNQKHHSLSDGPMHHGTHPYHGSTRHHSSTLKSSPSDPPRSYNKAPSTIDRIKSNLKNPNQSSPTLSHQHYHQHEYNSPPSPQMHSNMMRYEDGPVQQHLPVPTPKAYLSQSFQMKRSLERLQRLDSGKVEDRTI